MTDTTFNGWANWETWNASLWLQNDEFLYAIARRAYSWADCIERLAACGITETGDGLAYNSPDIDTAEMEEMLDDL